jgi:hypothetical protein
MPALAAKSKATPAACPVAIAVLTFSWEKTRSTAITSGLYLFIQSEISFSNSNNLNSRLASISVLITPTPTISSF